MLRAATRSQPTPATPADRADFVLHTYVPTRTGLLPGVDLEDKDPMADLLEGDTDRAPA